MNVYELKRMLENLPDEAEVRLATQPSWPFEYTIGEIVYPADQYELLFVPASPDTKGGWHVINASEDPQDEHYWLEGPFESEDAAKEKLDDLREMCNVYISEGGDQKYLPGEVKRALSW